MDGLYEMTGSALPVDIDGKTYLLGPLTAADEGEIERRILSERRPLSDVLADMLPKLDSESKRILLDIAWQDEARGPRVKYRDKVEWLATHRGRLYRLWLMFRRNHPELTIEDVEALAAKAGGLDREASESGKPLGNSSAPDQAGATEKVSHTLTPPGAESSDTSQLNTDGHHSKSAK